MFPLVAPPRASYDDAPTATLTCFHNMITPDNGGASNVAVSLLETSHSLQLSPSLFPTASSASQRTPPMAPPHTCLLLPPSYISAHSSSPVATATVQTRKTPLSPSREGEVPTRRRNGEWGTLAASCFSTLSPWLDCSAEAAMYAPETLPPPTAAVGCPETRAHGAGDGSIPSDPRRPFDSRAMEPHSSKPTYTCPSGSTSPHNAKCHQGASGLGTSAPPSRPTFLEAVAIKNASCAAAATCTQRPLFLIINNNNSNTNAAANATKCIGPLLTKNNPIAVGRRHTTSKGQSSAATATATAHLHLAAFYPSKKSYPRLHLCGFGVGVRLCEDTAVTPSRRRVADPLKLRHRRRRRERARRRGPSVSVGGCLGANLRTSAASFCCSAAAAPSAPPLEGPSVY